MPFEAHFISQLQQLVITTPFSIALAIFLARYLILIFIPIGAIFVVDPKRRMRHAAVEAMWSALVALAITALTAFIIQRLRPFQLPFDPAFPIHLLIPPPFNTSFPSGHTGTTIAIATAFAYRDRNIGIAAYMVAFLVAFGRMAVGVHFPSDILGGILVGLASFAIVRFIHAQIHRPDINTSARHHHHPA